MNRLNRIVVLTLSFAFLICAHASAQFSEHVAAGGTGRISTKLIIQEQIRPGDGVARSAQFQEDDLVNPTEDDDSDNVDLLDEDGRERAEDLELEFEDDDERDNRRPERPAFGAWPRKGIRAISLDIRDNDMNRPKDRSAQLLNSDGASWTQFAPTQKVFAWVAPNIRYQPLYFEDVAPERYGQTACGYRQSVRSGCHFFKSLLFLPYSLAVDHPQGCEYPLGFCRPGNTVDYTIQKHWFGR